MASDPAEAARGSWPTSRRYRSRRRRAAHDIPFRGRRHCWGRRNRPVRRVACSSGRPHRRHLRPGACPRASWAAAGMLAPTTEGRWGEGTLQALSQASANQWPAYASALEEDSGLPVGLRRDGTLSVALDADDYRVLEESFAVQREMGCNVELLTGQDCRRLEPSLNPRVAGGVLSAGDHQVDNRALLGALTQAVARRGVDLLRSAVRAIRRTSHRARGRSGTRRRHGAGSRQGCGGCRMAVRSPWRPGRRRRSTGPARQGPDFASSLGSLRARDREGHPGNGAGPLCLPRSTGQWRGGRRCHRGGAREWTRLSP